MPQPMSDAVHDELAAHPGRPNELRRVVRILRIIQAIADEPQLWTRAMLAEEHQVSERMITKDLEIIRDQLGLALGHSAAGYWFEVEPSIGMRRVARAVDLSEIHLY